uniref:Arrestin_C domain-containing protein n=1 Tax=Trichuris muris TaxID=70415 RepID=A0A5S6Q919_TRIMR
MGKIRCLEIVLIGEQGTFPAGRLIEGNLLLVVNQSQRIDRISVRFRGRAKTNWTKHQGKTSTHYGDQEVYFDNWINTQYVDMYQGNVVPAGCHRIPFTFRLPERLPSSYEGLYGNVRYDCTAVLSRAWKLDLVCRKAFRVLAAVDLNSMQDVGRPLKFRETQDIYCCCFRRGSLGLNVQLPKIGYTPGELLDASCEIVNNSTKTIDIIVVALKQYVTFRGKTLWLSHNGIKEVSKDVTQLELSTSIEPGAGSQLGFQIFVPMVPPRMVACSIIDIEYLLKIRVGAWLHCSIPIVIGTIPVNAASDQSVSPSSQNLWPLEHASAESDGHGSSYSYVNRFPMQDTPPPYRPETPPPSYDTCLLVGGVTHVRCCDLNDSDETSEDATPMSSFYPLLACDRYS